MIRKTIIVVSILAAIATASAWVASYVVSYKEMARYGIDARGFEIQDLDRGEAVACVFREGWISCVAMNQIKPTDQIRDRDYSAGGFEFMIFTEPLGPIRHWIRRLVMPFWFPFVLFAAYPTIALIRGPLCRRYRRNHGLCPHCGYNLTGNVTGICSECGKPTAP